MSERKQGWDAKEIANIAKTHYGSFATMFEKHGWEERGSKMMTSVQKHVTNEYGSVENFVIKHSN